jgi:hypothetical protein
MARLQRIDNATVIHLAISRRGEVVVAARSTVVLHTQGSGRGGDLLDVLLGGQALVVMHVLYHPALQRQCLAIP